MTLDRNRAWGSDGEGGGTAKWCLSKQAVWRGDLPSRTLTQVLVQDADLLVPTCHRAEFPWPLYT